MNKLILLMLLMGTAMLPFAHGDTPVASSAVLPPPVADLADKTVVDTRVRRYVTPTRLVWQSRENGAKVETPEKLLQAGSGQVTLSAPASCVLRNEGKTPGILLDFGRELQGGVQIAVQDLKAVGSNGKTVRLRVRFGESVSEAMSELGEKGSQTDHATRDQICQAPWLGTVEVGNTGFRFVRIDLEEPGAMLALKSVRAVFLYRDLPYLGSFRCSDERLNRIWQTGAYTVHLNMQDYLWDGIKRDRLVWIGDMHPETSTISAVFGNVDIVPLSLDLIRNETPPGQWMNGISSYSLWWIIIQQDWYRHNGDLAYLRQQQPYLTALVQELQKHIGANNEETLPEGRFLDWPSSENKPAIHAGLHALLVLAFQAGAEMCHALGDNATQQQCLDAVARLRKHVPDPNHSKQAAALMALAGLGDAKTLNHDVLAVDGAKRLSTFYGYYVLQARAKAGRCIRAAWTPYGNTGAGCWIWARRRSGKISTWTGWSNAGRIDELPVAGKKDIHGDYGAYCYVGFRHSLCHGWASGPTPWLSEHVLGVQIMEPGCKTLKITPHLGDLQWAEGAFPTPLGVVNIRHDKQPDGSVKSKVNAPPGVRLVK